MDRNLESPWHADLWKKFQEAASFACDWRCDGRHPWRWEVFEENMMRSNQWEVSCQHTCVSLSLHLNTSWLSNPLPRSWQQMPEPLNILWGRKCHELCDIDCAKKHVKFGFWTVQLNCVWKILRNWQFFKVESGNLRVSIPSTNKRQKQKKITFVVT